MMQKKRKRTVNNEEGFTLIEIIAVLVIIGILSAVALPKFSDLQAKARQKAMYTGEHEIKARVYQYFAKQLQDGVPAESVVYPQDSVGINIGADFSITNWDSTSVATTISYTLTYHPNSQTTFNAVTKSITLSKPNTG